MVWYSLKVGDNTLRIKKLEATKEKWADVSENGNAITKVCKQKGNYVWIDSNGNEVPTRYKLINGKPTGSLTRTKQADKFKEVESSEAFDLIPQICFYVEGNQALLNKLQTENKAIKFAYTTSGFEGGFYRAYLVAEKGELMMYCGNAYKSQEIFQAKSEQTAKSKPKTTSNGIERAKVEDLLEI
jgi:hypothetical protein